MDVVAAWQATVELFTKVFDWRTGGRTQEANALRVEAEDAQRQADTAVAHGNADELSRARTQQRRVRDTARAKRSR